MQQNTSEEIFAVLSEMVHEIFSIVPMEVTDMLIMTVTGKKA